MDWKQALRKWKKSVIKCMKNKMRKSHIYLIGVPERKNIEDEGKKI